MLIKALSFEGKRVIYRIHAAHTLRNVALSFVSVYVPIFLFTLGFSLSRVIGFYVVLHLTGLVSVFIICLPFIKRYGAVRLLRWYYPFQILFFALIQFVPALPQVWVWIAAVIGGLANFVYWVPMNMLLLRYSDKESMGNDLGFFFALPKFFGIAGPLLGAVAIPFFGFWPFFALSMIGLAISYYPLRGPLLLETETKIELGIANIWRKFKQRKLLFVLEGIDNVVEESEWFWGIFVYLMIGSLEAPGVVGSLKALGGAFFTVLVGKYAQGRTRVLVPAAALGLAFLWLVRFFVDTPTPAYAISVVASFAMTCFLVSYFTMIYRAVKKDREEEFLILREIPTVLGRMVVFGVILLSVGNLRQYFFLPIAAILLLLLTLLLVRLRVRRTVGQSDVDAELFIAG